MKGVKRISVLLSAIFLSCTAAMADGGVNNVNAPFSKFGLGSLHNQGSTVNTAMGGAGVAVRNHSFINVLNPAAVTARDSLAFMAEFGLRQGNSYFRQARDGESPFKTASNTFNIDHIVMSFPIWRSSAFMLGISPYSSVGYSFYTNETNPDVIGHSGGITDAYSGTGDIYKLYLGAGATFWKRLSLGAQFDYYFGTVEKAATRTFTSSEYRSVYSGYQMRLRGFSGKVGMQYEQPIGKDKLSAGFTYRIPTQISGFGEYMSYAEQSSVTDSLSHKTLSLNNLMIPQEFTAGIAYKHEDKLTLAFDYTYSDWRKSGMDVVKGFSNDGFTTSVSQSFKAGFEYVPNRNDIRYYMRRCSYRGGIYYKEDYFKYMNHKVSDMGVSLGMTLPVFRWLNGLSVAMNVGQRGSLRGVAPGYSPIRERYITFSVSFDIFDIWFLKPKYD